MRFRPLPILALAAIGWGSALAAPAPPPVVTLLGDSITAGYGLAAADALPAQLQASLNRIGVAAAVRGAGVSGDTSAGGLARVDFSVQPDTTLCVVELGANDYLQSLAPGAMRSNLVAIVRAAEGAAHPRAAGGRDRACAHGRGLCARVQRRLPRRRPSRGGGAGIPTSWPAWRPRPGLRQADGLHPNAAGVRVIADRLARSVAAALSRR